jgi:membrane associated rhomboid family serine protease
MQLGQGRKFELNFKKNDTLMRLIYINVAVFLGIVLIKLPFSLMGTSLSHVLNDSLALPASLSSFIVRPWTLVSYMFLHYGLSHIVFNMLALFMLGQLFVQFLGNKKLIGVYISGGIAGGILYMIAFNIFPTFQGIIDGSYVLGASGSVMAIVFATCFYQPNFIVKLMFIGEVRLKYIALVFLILDLVSISGSTNAIEGNYGGHIAHIGGAALGFLFAKQWKQGKDITNWVGRSIGFILALFKSSSKSKMKVKYKRPTDDYEYQSRKKDEQEKIDIILDKISKSGYESLSKAEKEILFKASNK